MIFFALSRGVSAAPTLAATLPPAVVAGLPWVLFFGVLGWALWRESRARDHSRRGREAEARLLTMMENLPFDFWAMDANGRYALLNSAARRNWGDQIGKRPEELDVPAETLARWQENNRRAFQGEVVRGEVSFQRGGELHFFENIVAPIISEGAVRGILGMNIEITEQKRASTAQRRSELRFRALLTNSTDAVAVFSATGQIMFASTSTERILGYTEDEFVGRNAFDFIHPEDQAIVESQLRVAVAHPGTAVPARIRVRHRDGRWRLLAGTYTDLTGDPAVAGIVGNYRDVSGRAAAEDALRESEVRFDAFIDHSPAVIFMKDAELRYLHINRRFERVFGLRREVVIGRTDEDLFPPDQARIFAENDRRTLAEGRTLEFEEPAQYVDGPHLSIVQKFTLGEGPRAVLCGIATDITERRQLEAQLRQAQRMESIGQLAGGVAHDFNNLLTVIQGHASLVEIAPDLAPEVFDSVQQIIIAADRAANLTRQLLAFSRRQFILPRDLQLNEVVTDMTKMLRRILGEDIHLHFAPPATLPLVHADPGMLEHVLLNLALNARDAMPQGGGLTLATDEQDFTAEELPAGSEAVPGRYVRLRVSDTGTGIAPEHLPRIFEPFFTTKGVGRGTGLGLATVYGIVRQHHGWIEVTSTPEGSTFAVHLPAVKP